MQMARTTRELLPWLFVFTPLVVVFGVNVVEFDRIDGRVPSQWRALDHAKRFSPSATVRHRYGEFIDVGTYAAGADLIVPTKEWKAEPRLASFKSKIFGLGRISKYVNRNYDPTEILAGLALSPGHRQADPLGAGEVYTLDENVETLIFALDGGRRLYVDVRLVPDSRMGRLK